MTTGILNVGMYLDLKFWKGKKGRNRGKKCERVFIFCLFVSFLRYIVYFTLCIITDFAKINRKSSNMII